MRIGEARKIVLDDIENRAQESLRCLLISNRLKEVGRQGRGNLWATWHRDQVQMTHALIVLARQLEIHEDHINDARQRGERRAELIDIDIPTQVHIIEQTPSDKADQRMADLTAGYCMDCGRHLRQAWGPTKCAVCANA
jgi:hypothetical protein